MCIWCPACSTQFVPVECRRWASRYLLLEPSHHVCPPRFCESVFELIGAGYVPVITHPERLTWAQDHLDDFFALARSGAWLQVTGGALTGKFGARTQRLAERFVGDGWTAILASDAHDTAPRASAAGTHGNVPAHLWVTTKRHGWLLIDRNLSC